MKKRKTVKKRYVIALVIVIAGLITLWRILNAPVPTYQTLIVRPGDLQQSVLATGKLDALRKVDVGAQVSGQLKTLSVAIGDKVKKDQLLGVIDPEQAENQIKEVEATLMELRAAAAGGSGAETGAGDVFPSATSGTNAGGFTAGSRHRRDGDGCETGANWHH